MTRLIVVGTAGLSGAFSVVAAQAFKGHGHTPPRARSTAGTTTNAATAVAPIDRVAVAPPQHVPQIAGQRASLQAPSAPPAAATAAPQPTPQAAPAPAPAPPPPPPVVSGGS